MAIKTAQEELDEILAAEAEALKFKTAVWGDRTISHQNLSELQAAKRAAIRRLRAEQRSPGYSVARFVE